MSGISSSSSSSSSESEAPPEKRPPPPPRRTASKDADTARQGKRERSPADRPSTRRAEDRRPHSRHSPEDVKRRREGDSGRDGRHREEHGDERRRVRSPLGGGEHRERSREGGRRDEDRDEEHRYFSRGRGREGTERDRGRERERDEGRSHRRSASPPTHRHARGRSPVKEDQAVPRSDPRACFNCGETGHLARDCPVGGGVGGGRRPDTRACHKCGEVGHIARECPRAGAGDELPSGKIKWGTAEQQAEEEEARAAREKGDLPPPEPEFGLSGKLADESNTVKGVVMKFQEPTEARKPQKKWRLYVFKGETALDPMHIHRQATYMFGRERKVVDIPTDHPSCSKQHAVLVYRETQKEDEDGLLKSAVRPYLMDLSSVNGTFLNGERMDAQRYYELLEQDNIKFGNSSRDYVLLHDKSQAEED